MDRRTEGYVLFFLSLTVVCFFVYGILSHPELQYNLSTDIVYNETWDFLIGAIPIYLHVENTGSNPASIGIVVRYYNATHPTAKVQNYDGYRDISIEMEEPINVGEVRQVNVSMIPEEGHDYIALLFYPLPIRDLNPISSFDESFTQLQDVRPTAILLRHIEDQIYMRVRGK